MARPGKLQFRKPPLLRKLAAASAVAAITGLPPGAQLSASAPAAKFQIQCDIAPNIAIRQVAPTPRASQWSDSAPVLPFLPVAHFQSQPLTLATLPRPFIPVETAQWQGKYQVTSDVFVNGLLYLPQPIPAIVPLAGGGLLPGRPPEPPEELGRGMGPYKRPGQVFGEPDPISPRLSSRAEVAAGYIAPPVVLTQPFVESLFHVEQLDEDTAVFALLALEELCGSDPVRGPIALHIVRRKV